MKTITKYVADDGSEWGDEFAAKNRESLVLAVRDAMTFLKPTPNDLNWEGYVQQTPTLVLQCKCNLFAIANQDGILKCWIDRQKNDHGKTEEDLIVDCHPSWFGRILDGSCRPLETAYGRLCCIDEKCREWNQPYFALNPSKGRDVCVG